MPFVPIDLMEARVRKFGSDSDAALFHEMLYLGEFFTKITTAAFVAAILDDRENHRYAMMHALVRADGVGAWATKLEEALSGPTSQHLVDASKPDRNLLNERVGKGAWQYEAMVKLREALRVVHPSIPPLSDRVTGRAWFSMFATLRNKTRGHGAVTPASSSRILPYLKESISIMIDNSTILQKPWAYLHRNLSGKYNISMIGGNTSAFDDLKSVKAVAREHYQDGLCIYLDGPKKVDLIYTDLDASDFYFPNGAFNGKRFECHSLITDSRRDEEATPYIQIAGNRPESETHGRGEIDILGNVYTNIPLVPSGYVPRPGLEVEIRDTLLNDRHAVVTLVGRGGIGKTSLALSVLHEIALTTHYDMILWFSARDIDLSKRGPKVVQPQVLTELDIANDFVKLAGDYILRTEEPDQKNKSSLDIMSEQLRRSSIGPILFVFDNFETVRSPVDLFQWIDTNIRLPNKAMITSRFRDFKADYPIEISGMEKSEAEILITQTAASLNVTDLINATYREQIFDEANGHPYVMKIIIGEVANARAAGKPKQIIARKDEILEALFERTFSGLSPIASRIFLILSGWRSLVPQLALEATILRNPGDGIDPEAGVNELVRMSLVERISAPDGADFLSVPLTAAIFGMKKLAVSPTRVLIETDTRFLQEIGPTATGSIRAGILPRILSLFRAVAKRIGDQGASLDEYRSVLEYVARNYNPAWLMLADLQSEVQGDSASQRAAEYVRRFLEQQPNAPEAHAAWDRLVRLYRSDNNIIAATGAFLGAAEHVPPPLQVISDMSNALNNERDAISGMSIPDRMAVFGPMIEHFERHLTEASSTDLSRLAWLHLHAGDIGRALQVAELGLRKDPSNIYCQKLVERLENNS